MKSLCSLLVVVLLTGCPDPSSPDSGTNGGGGGSAGFDSGFTPVLPGVEAQGYAVVASGTNAFVVGNGTNDGGTASLMVARFKPDRTLDPTWASGGLAIVDVANGPSIGIGVLASDTGYAGVVDGTSLFVCGTAQAPFVPGDGQKVMLAKFLADGSLDPTFGNTGMTNGIRLDAFGMTAASCTAVVVQPDGKILIGGAVGTDPNFFVTRYLPNGTADVAFSKTPGTGFGAVWGTARAEQTRSMVLDPDGKIVVFGGSGMSAARLLPNGQLDTAFGSAGFFTSPGADGLALWREADGSYLAVGSTPLTTDAGGRQLAVRFLKLSSNGIADVTFGVSGYREVVLPGTNDALGLRGVARLADGFVFYVTGLSTTSLVRFNADYTLDTTQLVQGQLKPTSIRLPLLHPSGGSHLAVTEGNRVWVTDINLVTLEPVTPTTKNFFELINQTF